jgi:hypothetical protein
MGTLNFNPCTYYVDQEATEADPQATTKEIPDSFCCPFHAFIQYPV